MDFSQNFLGFPDIHVVPAPWMIWSGFGLFMLGYLVLSSVLYYHWITYGMSSRGILIAQVLFPFGSVFFIYIAWISLSLI